VGEDGDSPEEGGTKVVEGRTFCESEASSLDDAQPARTMQAAAIATAHLGNWSEFIWNLFSVGAGHQTDSAKSLPNRAWRGAIATHQYPRKFSIRHSNVTFFFE